MSRLNFSNPYWIVWQSKVGLQPWLGPHLRIHQPSHAGPLLRLAILFELLVCGCQGRLPGLHFQRDIYARGPQTGELHQHACGPIASPRTARCCRQPETNKIGSIISAPHRVQWRDDLNTSRRSSPETTRRLYCLGALRNDRKWTGSVLALRGDTSSGLTLRWILFRQPRPPCPRWQAQDLRTWKHRSLDERKGRRDTPKQPTRHHWLSRRGVTGPIL